ncbi:hypothetical protein AA0117_g10412 [Alternaria alternata]|jgi:hypothetical protein|uniref:Uncharacterized protein n=1 Tax=Alternaria alternata TaxID=5599 RepID=A0A4Q4N5N1_ALTAL|nr:hypothetical protein AA0117_g10412 [Alternaria alternata]
MDLDIIALVIVILICFTVVLCYVWKPPPPPPPLHPSASSISNRISQKPRQKDRARPLLPLSTMHEETDWEDASAMRIPLCDLDFPALDE